MNPADRSELAGLVHRAQGGDSSALAELVGRYGTPLYRFCYRHLRSKEKAEDAAQEAFAKAIQKLGELEDAARFDSWLYQIAMNVCRDEWTRSNRLRELAEGVDPPDSRVSPHKDLEIVEQLERVKAAVAELPNDQREAFVLIHYERKSYQAAAEILGIPIATVKTRVFRALKRLREQLLKDIEG